MSRAPSTSSESSGAERISNATREPASSSPDRQRRWPEPLIRGWLRVLCIVLFVWQPVLFARAASTAIAAIPARGPAVALVLAARLFVTALGVAAAILIVRRREVAIRTTIAALAAAGN